MANAELLPHVIALLEEGHTVTLPLRGNSMRPFLHDGRDKAILTACHEAKVGEVVLAEITPGHYVLHRVKRVEGSNVTLLGDGNLNPEHCQQADIRAKAVAFYRKKRTKPDSTSGKKWRYYSWWWTRLTPIRRYLLFLCNPHVPRRFFKRAS